MERDWPRDLRDLAADYVLGVLSADEAARFERLLQADAGMREEVRAFQEVCAYADQAAQPEDPPPHLRDRLLAAIRDQGAALPDARQLWKRWRAADAPRGIVRRDAGGWQATEFAGVDVRRLGVDDAGDRVTMLIRMARGARYPGHRHAGLEECFVLEGDLRHGDEVMRAGDYEWCDGGSEHGVQWTEGGCLLLIHSSRADELLGA